MPEDRILSRWVTIRFNIGDVRDDELRSLHAEIRKFFGTANTNRLTWLEVDFLSLGDGMGGPPKYGRKTTFWEEVLRQWKEKPAAQYLKLSSWRAVRNKYEKLDGRTNVRELMTPNPPPPPRSQAEFADLKKRNERLPPHQPRKHK